MNKKPKLPLRLIQAINMNGLRGQLVRLSAPEGKPREILIVNATKLDHARLYHFAKDINRYGAVTLADLPGFGGTQSFYKIGERPTIDNQAGYLAAFVKLKYKRRRLTIIGLGYGFTAATRMLQNYPELAKKIDLLISLDGFVHRNDIRRSSSMNRIKRYSLSVASARLPAWFIKVLASNDLRSQLATEKTKLRLNICDKSIDLPVYHINGSDKQFDNQVIEQHLQIIYRRVHIHKLKNNVKLEDRLLGPKPSQAMLSKSLRRMLAKA